MILSIPLKLEGSGIGMIMSLHHHINLILIHQWSKLCTKYHTIRIRMIITRTENILMEYYDSPFCIFIFRDCLFHNILVCCTVVIVGIKYDKKHISVAVIVIRSCFCLALDIICIFAWKSIWIVKMQRILIGNRIMITNRSCYRKRC